MAETVRPGCHPVLAPARLLFDQMGFSVEPSAIVVMASGVHYVDADGSDENAFGGFDAAFDLFEAAGFNCEQFRTHSAPDFIAAAHREYSLSVRRWKATPLYSLYPDRNPRSGETVIVPVGLSDLTKDSLRVTSMFSDRIIPYQKYVEADLALWGYAAPVPSLRAFVTSRRFGFTDAATRSLRLTLQRMWVASDGLCVLDRFLASDPAPPAVDRYRTRLRAQCCGDDSYFRATLTDAIDRYGSSFVADRTREGFERSGRLHRDFLAGDDSALAEIARTERVALDSPRLLTALPSTS